MTIFWNSQIVNSKDGIAKRIKIAAMLLALWAPLIAVFWASLFELRPNTSGFALRATTRQAWNTGELQILRLFRHSLSKR